MWWFWWVKTNRIAEIYNNKKKVTYASIRFRGFRPIFHRLSAKDEGKVY